MNRKQLAAMHMKRLGTYNYARYGKSLEKIGKDAGLVGHNLDVYKLSMERRFPHHTRPGKVNEHYMSEWAERFRDGSALRKADLETLAAIKRAESEVKVAELKDVSRAEPWEKMPASEKISILDAIREKSFEDQRQKSRRFGSVW
jgi:hypothetical protein